MTIEEKNTPDIYLFTYSPKGQTKSYDWSYMYHFNEYFKSWTRCMEDYEINPELNAAGNLHYHGYYIVKDKFAWFSKVLPKLKYNGILKVDKVKDSLEKGMIYPRKDREFMKNILKVRPIPITMKDHKFDDITIELNKNTLANWIISPLDE